MSASRFDRTADQYAAAARARDWSGMVAWCEPQSGDRVLDVAGGTGALAEALQGRVAEMTVADVSEPMLANVPAWAQRVVARAEQLPFEDESFDLVTCVRALHHIESPTRAMDEMARLAAPGGRVVIEDFLADPDPGNGSPLGARGAPARRRSSADIGVWRSALAAARGGAFGGRRGVLGGDDRHRQAGSSWPAAIIRWPPASGRRSARPSFRSRSAGHAFAGPPRNRGVRLAAGVRRSMSRSISARLHSRSCGEREGDVSRHCPLASASRMQYMSVWMSRLSSIVGCASTSAATPDPLLGVVRWPSAQAHPLSEAGYSARHAQGFVAALIGTSAGVSSWSW